MRRPTLTTLSGWLAGLALALGGAWAGAARAADVLFVADQPEPAAEAQPAHPSQYWIGLECVPVGPALRSQLGLPEHEGVMVASVMPESPAAKAGIKPHDVLVKAGDKPLRGIKVLVEAVEQSKDKPLTLELFRDGKSQKIDVTPAKRPGEIREEYEQWNEMPAPPSAATRNRCGNGLRRCTPATSSRCGSSSPGPA